MVLSVFAFHENFAFGTLNQRIMTSLDRVQVEVTASRLSTYVGALANFVRSFIPVYSSVVVKFAMVLHCTGFNIFRLLYK